MGWAAGFRAGSQVAGEALDTYRQGVLARDIKAAQGLAPEEIKAPAATQAQVDAATAETNAMAAQDAQDFGLDQPMQYRAPQVGQATAPSRFKLGNQTLDTAPTEQQIAGVRRRAMVDAMTRFDPVQGMRMGMELERDDRERTRFTNEQSDRDTAKALERARREYYKSLSGIKDGNQLAEMLGGSFSTDGSGVDAMLTFDEKSNKFLFASRVPGMPSRQLDRAELINMAMGVWEQGNGDFNRGMQMVLDGLREQRRLGEVDRADAARVAEGNAGLFWKDRNYGLEKDKYNLEDWYKRRQVGLDRRRVAAAEGQARLGRIVDVENPDGTRGIAEINVGPNGPQLRPVTMAQGVRLPGAKLDPKDYTATVKNLMEADPTLSLPMARIQADALYQRGPKAAAAPDDKSLVEKNQSSRAGGTPRSADIPARVTPYNPAAFERFIEGAKNGDPLSISLVKGWVETNQLSAGERRIATSVLGQ